ncbi:hypothetical protein HK099_001076, partial [Clydaea vesicula]
MVHHNKPTIANKIERKANQVLNAVTPGHTTHGHTTHGHHTHSTMGPAMGTHGHTHTHGHHASPATQVANALTPGHTTHGHHGGMAGTHGHHHTTHAGAGGGITGAIKQKAHEIKRAVAP